MHYYYYHNDIVCWHEFVGEYRQHRPRLVHNNANPSGFLVRPSPSSPNNSRNGRSAHVGAGAGGGVAATGGDGCCDPSDLNTDASRNAAYAHASIQVGAAVQCRVTKASDALSTANVAKKSANRTRANNRVTGGCA